MILGVIAGFIAWSILWVGTDQVLRSASPDWYGSHQLGMEAAMFNGEPFQADASILLISLLRSIVFSIAAGFLAAVIANENGRAPLWLGILLLAFGLIMQIAAWNYLPVWYHLVFLALLIPMSVVGGRLRRS